MNIAFISNLLEPTGGDEILINHIKGLKACGHNAVGWFTGVMDAAKDKYDNECMAIYNADKIDSIGLQDYDIVIANGLFGANKIIDMQDINKAFFLQNFDPYIFPEEKEFIDKVYNSFDKYLLYSSCLQTIVKNYYGEKKFVKCNNGIDYNLISDYREDKSPRKSVCFMTAYYRPYKGIKLCNEVFGLLKDKGYTTVEICAVNGPLDNTMEFYRNPPMERKCEIITQCSVMLHPSVFETWNLVSMESMALGTPVVGTDSKGIMEYATNENSIIIPDRDPNRLVEKIEQLCGDNDLYSRLQNNGIETASIHDWDVIMPSIEQCYKELI